MNKKLVISIMTLILILGSIGLGYAYKGQGLFVRDKVLEENPYAKEKPTVKIDKVEKLPQSQVAVKLASEISVDGSFIYEVFSENTKVGEFYYKPWLQKHPISTHLPNGNILLGSNKVYNVASKKITDIAPETAVLDYAVAHDSIAYIGKNSGDPKYYIYLKDLTNNQVKTIDSFQYPSDMTENKPYLAWNKTTGTLYYDYCINEKPVIKQYDMASGSTNIFTEEAINPQLSLNGTYMLVEAMTGFSKAERNASKLKVLAIKSKEALFEVAGSNKVFWVPNGLLTWDPGQSNMIKYNLTKKAKTQEIPLNRTLPIKVTENNGKIRINGVKFQENSFVVDELTVNSVE